MMAYIWAHYWGNITACSERVIVHNMSALVNEPTRITPTSATGLEQILAIDHLPITDNSVVSPLETSDDCEITCLLKFPKKYKICSAEACMPNTFCKLHW